MGAKSLAAKAVQTDRQTQTDTDRHRQTPDIQASWAARNPSNEHFVGVIII